MQHSSLGGLHLFPFVSLSSLSFFFGSPFSLPLTFPSRTILLSSRFFNFKTLWSHRQPRRPSPSPETDPRDSSPFFPTTYTLRNKGSVRVLPESFQRINKEIAKFNMVLQKKKTQRQEYKYHFSCLQVHLPSVFVHYHTHTHIRWQGSLLLVDKSHMTSREVCLNKCTRINDRLWIKYRWEKTPTLASVGIDLQCKELERTPNHHVLQQH